MKSLKGFAERRLLHAKRRVEMIKKAHGKDPGLTHTYWGGQHLGYWQGKVSSYEFILDELERSECQKY